MPKDTTRTLSLKYCKKLQGNCATLKFFNATHGTHEGRCRRCCAVKRQAHKLTHSGAQSVTTTPGRGVTRRYFSVSLTISFHGDYFCLYLMVYLSVYLFTCLLLLT